MPTSPAAPSQLLQKSWLRGPLNIVGMFILLSVAQHETVHKILSSQGQVEELVEANISNVDGDCSYRVDTTAALEA